MTSSTQIVPKVPTPDTVAWPSGPGLPDPPAEFLIRDWSDIFPGLNGNTSFDQDVGKFLDVQKTEAKCAQKAAEERKERFMQMLKDWDAEHDKEKTEGQILNRKKTIVAKVRANISATHSWKEIFAALHTAENGYKSPKGIRKWIRKGADHAEYIEPFLNFIPDGDYTSVICGGIKFVLSAFAAAKKSREQIYDLIDTLPQKVETTGQYSELYSAEPTLQIATNQLYSKILWAIEAIIAQLTKDRTFEFLKPLLLHNAYSPLQQEIEDVRKASEKLENVLQWCDRKRLAEINQGVNGVKQDVAVLMNLFLSGFRAQWEATKWVARVIEQQREPKDQPPAPKAYISSEALSQILLLGSSSIAGTMHEITSQTLIVGQVLQAGFAMDRENLIRAGWLMSEKKLHRWFKSSHSRAILVNGNSLIERITPVSFFCALLIRSLKAMKPVVVLNHFCGLYTPSNGDPGEVLSGGCGMLKSLSSQLAAQWKFGEMTCLDQEDVEVLKASSPNLSLEVLKRLFRSLVTALPAGQPLFIIIDNINYYETSDLGDDTKKAIEEITQLLGNKEVRVLAKILVTSANRAFEVADCFWDDEKIFVPDNPSGDEMGFAEKHFESQFGSTMADLESSF